jgi:hypothetical protein
VRAQRGGAGELLASIDAQLELAPPHADAANRPPSAIGKGEHADAAAERPRANNGLVLDAHHLAVRIANASGIECVAAGDDRPARERIGEKRRRELAAEGVERLIVVRAEEAHPLRRRCGAIDLRERRARECAIGYEREHAPQITSGATQIAAPVFGGGAAFDRIDAVDRVEQRDGLAITPLPHHHARECERDFA